MSIKLHFLWTNQHLALLMERTVVKEPQVLYLCSLSWPFYSLLLSPPWMVWWLIWWLRTICAMYQSLPSGLRVSCPLRRLSSLKPGEGRLPALLQLAHLALTHALILAVFKSGILTIVSAPSFHFSILSQAQCWEEVCVREEGSLLGLWDTAN